MVKQTRLTIGILCSLPETTLDSEYLQATLNHAAHVLFPVEDNPTMDLHGQGPEGDSALHVATTLGDLRAVRLLINAGVKVNCCDEMNETPLHRAVNGRFLDIIEYLLNHGASADYKGSFGYSPREWASQMGYRDVVELFSKYK